MHSFARRWHREDVTDDASAVSLGLKAGAREVRRF
jgi:hypothetical protein